MPLKIEIVDNEERGHGNILKVWHDDNLLREEYDNGEPEDNSFYRDWNWVIEALEEAYEAGKKDATP